uniref:HNH endonuclease n=1 Tax=Microbacterium proteolyticum TaxID=1572644 RepID=UPI00241642B2|nr:HNH endonuclease [Microbacterium proteolyticum]
MPETLECGWCGEEFTRKTVRSRFCTSRCGTKFKQTKRRGTQAGSPGTYSWADIVKLWLKFDKCCAYCRLSVPMTNIEAEHVIPLSKGGANNTTNLLPSCKRCNSDKRDLLLHEWALDRERRHLDPVHTAWAPDDERYKHLVMSTHALAA